MTSLIATRGFMITRLHYGLANSSRLPTSNRGLFRDCPFQTLGRTTPRRVGNKKSGRRLGPRGQVAGHKVDVPKVRSSKVGGEFFWQEVDETERLPVEPDAPFTLRFADRAEGQQLTHFCYEADRGSMVMTDMLKKFRGYYHFIKKQQKHREAFHVHPIRAVLVETTDEARGKKLMELVGHPLVAGPVKRAGLFWFSISPLFTDPIAEYSIPRYLDHPEAIFDPIWALPDHSLHALGNAENTQAVPSTAPMRGTGHCGAPETPVYGG